LFTKLCQQVQLPAALLTCFLCALTVFCVNVQHFSLMESIGVLSLGRTKLIVIDSGVHCVQKKHPLTISFISP